MKLEPPSKSEIEVEALTYLCTLPTEHGASVSGSSSSLFWDPDDSGSGGGATTSSELEDPEPAMSALELESESDVDDSDPDDSASSSHEVAELEDILSFWLGFSASMATDTSGGLQFV